MAHMHIPCCLDLKANDYCSHLLRYYTYKKYIPLLWFSGGSYTTNVTGWRVGEIFCGRGEGVGWSITKENDNEGHASASQLLEHTPLALYSLLTNIFPTQWTISLAPLLYTHYLMLWSHTQGATKLHVSPGGPSQCEPQGISGPLDQGVLTPFGT